MILAAVLARLLPYRGRHRGVYQPSEHWRHISCDPHCIVKCNITFYDSSVELSGLVVLQ